MKKIILVVDDSATNLELTTYLLEEAGFGILKATNGLEAIKLARANRPDLVLCDIHMPGMDGLEVAQTLRNDPDLAHVPLIALTATAGPADIPSMMAAGFMSFFEKPISMAKFVDQVRQYLDGETNVPLCEPAL